jgi:hypothetical protein
MRFQALHRKAIRRNLKGMTQRFCPASRLSLPFGLLLFLLAPTCSRGDAPAAALSTFKDYAGAVELRLTRQHRSRDGFLAVEIRTPEDEARLRRGEFLLEQLTPPGGTELPGALLHHWRGTAFVPGATAAGFERLIRNFNAYPQHFAPEVVQARAVPLTDGHLQAWMRVRQRQVITVVMDSTYDVSFGQLDMRHGYSISRSTRIQEIDSPGTSRERALTSDEEHGFLWRLNTYWSYEERDGGLYMQIESVSLTRSVPTGLGWAVRPLVQSVPRESLEFTLSSARKALHP